MAAKEKEDLTFIEKIGQYRTFAHRPMSSDSEGSQSEGSSFVSLADGKPEKHREKSPGPPAKPPRQSTTTLSDNTRSNVSFSDQISPSTSGQRRRLSAKDMGGESGSQNHLLSRERTNENSSAPQRRQPAKGKGDFSPTSGSGKQNHVPTSTSGSGKQCFLPSWSASEDETEGTLHTMVSDPSLVDDGISSINMTLAPGLDGTGNETQDAAETGNDLRTRQVFYVNDETSKLAAFSSFNELSRYLVETKSNEANKVQNLDEFTKTILGVSVNNIVNHMTLGEYVQHLHAKNKMADVEVDVRGEKFPAHRVVLCCHSKYFHNLFALSKGSKTPFELKIKGVSAKAFASFLNFCYTGEIIVRPETAADLLIVSDHLQVSAMRRRCSEITCKLPVDQALKFVVNCTCSKQHRLYRNLFERVLETFSAACKLEEFLEMDLDRLCDFLDSDDLTPDSELEVFQAVVRWIAHNIEERVKYSMRLLSFVRFCHMSPADIHASAETTSLIRGYDKFREAILVANWQICSREHGRLDPFGFPLRPPRKCFHDITPLEEPVGDRVMPSLMLLAPPTSNQNSPVLTIPSVPQKTAQSAAIADILLFGGDMTPDTKQSVFVQRYDTSDNQWAHFCRLPVPRVHHAVAAIKGKVYLIGGSEQTADSMQPGATSTLFVLDLATKNWTRKSDMLTPRRGHCVCSTAGRVFAIGGKDNNGSVLKSVETYNPVTDAWAYVSPLNSPRFGACAARQAGNIIVAGGIGETSGVPSSLLVLNTVECYDVVKDSWTRRNNLRYPRCYANMVNLRERLFLCGGATRSFDYKSSVLVSMSAIDEYGEQDDVWSHLTDMVIPRHKAGAAAAGDKLYMVGGVSTKADRVLQSVECFDTKELSWMTGTQELPQPASSVCCTPIVSRWQRAQRDDLDPAI